MNQVQLSDEIYLHAQRRAAEAGYASVDEYIAEVVVEDLQDEIFDHLFTMERLSRIDEGVEQVRLGNSVTMTDVREAQDWQRRFGGPSSTP